MPFIRLHHLGGCTRVRSIAAIDIMHMHRARAEIDSCCQFSDISLFPIIGSVCSFVTSYAPCYPTKQCIKDLSTVLLYQNRLEMLGRAARSAAGVARAPVTIFRRRMGGGHGHAAESHGHHDEHLSAGAARYQHLTPQLFGEVRAPLDISVTNLRETPVYLVFLSYSMGGCWGFVHCVLLLSYLHPSCDAALSLSLTCREVHMGTRAT